MQALIFADGELGIGLGHISRSLSLKAEFEKQEIQTLLLDSKDCKKELNKGKFYDFIAIDSYILPLESYQLATKFAKFCFFFDDTMRLDYPQGILINNAISVDFKSYEEKYPNHTLFLGNSYTLLRPAFLKKLNENPKPLNAEIKNCLITLGGEDLLELNAPLTQAILDSYPHLKIHCITKNSLDKRIFTYYNLSAQEMVDLVSNMDICICAGGQTLREILTCGIPTIALEIANNQRVNLESFKECIYMLKNAYTLDKTMLCQFVLDSIKSYLPLAKRLKHQSLALKLTQIPTQWETRLKEIKTLC